MRIGTGITSYAGYSFTLPVFHARRNGSFLEQSHKMHERSVIWRQIYKLSIFVN